MIYQLPAVLVGCDGDVLPNVRRELLNNRADVAREYRDLDGLLSDRGVFAEGTHLFVVLMNGVVDLERLQRLTGIFVGQPVLAIVSAKCDSALLLKTMRAGATQVVTLPLQPEDFKAALDCIGLQFGQAKGPSRVIAFSGATGGCGVTITALNFAYDLAVLKGKRTILIEGALQMGMLETYLDANPKFTIRDLLDNGSKLDSHMVQKALTRIADNFDILPGPRTVMARRSSGGANLAPIIEYARFLADVVVLDLPPTLDEHYFEILSGAEQVVLLLEQKIPSVRNIQLILDVLSPTHVSNSCHLVINQYDPRLTGFTIKDLKKLLKVSNITSIASDPVSINAAANHGRPLRLEAPRSEALADIDHLIVTLFDGPQEKSVRAPESGIVRNIMRSLCLSN
jgi:pilus assembly protein CpaE